MKSAYSKRLLSSSSDETECYLYAKRTKTESDEKIREKKEQQKLEESTHCGSKYQTSPRKPLYLPERPDNWTLEKQSCDTARKTCMREFFSSKTYNIEGLVCGVSENKPSTKNWRPENEDSSPIEDDIPLNVRGQPLETELLNMSSTADTCQNLQVLNPPQVQQNNSIEQNNKRNEDNELKKNSSVTSLNRHMFELLSQKSVSNKRWQRHQLFQIPFLTGTSSVFSCIENKKRKFLKNVCSAEDKNYSSHIKDTSAKKDNKEKNNSLYIIHTLKPLKRIQPLEIPNFQFPRISNKMNNKQSSTKFRETDWKNFEGEPSLLQSKHIHGVEKISEIGKQKMQSDKSSVRASTVCSELKEKNCPPIKKQERSALAEGEVSGTYFRCNSTDTECNKILAENCFKDKTMENSEGDDDQKSKSHIYISAKNVQNEKCVCSNDLLQRRGRKCTNENAGTFHMQMSIPVTTEALEKNKLNLHCGVHDSNRDIRFYEAESKLSTKEILDLQSYVTKNITFKTSCNVFRGMEMLKLKFLFQNVLFGWVRMWTESFHGALPTCQDDSVTPWSHCRDILKEQCDAQELIYFCNITKLQYLVGANFRYQSYFPAHSQLKFEKAHKKNTNQEISVNTLKQEKNKPSIRLNSYFHVELFKAQPYVLYENKKQKKTGYRNCITSTNEVTNEVTYTMKKYLGNSFINADEKGCVNSKELQMNCHDFLSKKSFSIFDTYEKIPLATDSEDFDQIPVVKQDSSIQKKWCEESAVSGSKDMQCLPVKSNDVLTQSEQPKASTEEYNSFLLLDRQINKHENCKDLDTCSPHLAAKKVDNQNTYLFSENLFPNSSNIYQSVTLPLDSNCFVNREISEDGHCRNSSSADKQKTSETIPVMVQYLSMGNAAMTDTYLQLQAKETAPFSLQGHEQMNKTGSSEPATLKQHLEYVKEQEERNYEQMYVTNESQCESVMNYLIMSYSEDKSKTFIAAEEELKMHLSIMNNGCLEDVKDKYLPLENKSTHELELKRKFDLVLEELCMFHEISKENVNSLSSLETNLPNSYCKLNKAEGIDENMARVSQKNICISSPICGATKGKHVTDINESSLHEKILNENEDQKVSEEYSVSRMSSEELLHSPSEGKHIELVLCNQENLNFRHYLICFKGGNSYIILVQPLKTCKGPIRIGLSRKARPKKLHPYLK
uniref:RAD51 interacting motif domain-containing protein n=1 Tax=Cyanoderma ruficeps TaxID=181631 RepID=A0A8C3R127_9PASS